MSTKYTTGADAIIDHLQQMFGEPAPRSKLKPLAKVRPKPLAKAEPAKARPKLSSEPIKRARQRMYAAFRRAKGPRPRKFAKMLIAVRVRVGRSGEVKRRGIVEMLRQETCSRRWNAGEIQSLKQLLRETSRLRVLDGGLALRLVG